jgi:hypothetical protein
VDLRGGVSRNIHVDDSSIQPQTEAGSK